MTRYDEDTIIFKEISNFKVKCSCGHTFATTKEKDLCNWCGYYVYKDEKTEFKYKLKERMNKNDKKGNISKNKKS